MNTRVLCVVSPLVLCSFACADPVVPGANVSLLATLPPGYRPYTMDVGRELEGPYAGYWLYVGSDNNVVTGQVLVRIGRGVLDEESEVSEIGLLHSYCTAVYDPDGVLVDQSGVLTGVQGRVLVASSNPGDNAGVLLQVDASSNEGGDGFSSPHPYVNASLAIRGCDSMTVDDQNRLYLNSPQLDQIARMIGAPVNNGETFEAFASLPVASGTVVHDGMGRIWSSGSDGVVRRIPIETDPPTAPPREPSQMLEVDVGTGVENGLAWTRATPASGGGAWGGGVLVARRGTGNGELVRVRSHTAAQDLLGTGMGDVFAMKVDEFGVLYAADYTTGQVWRIERTERLGCGPGDVGGTGGVASPDGQLSNDDFIVFIDYFFGHDARADRGATGGRAGSDGVWNNNDFVVFIDEFFEGC